MPDTRKGCSTHSQFFNKAYPITKGETMPVQVQNSSFAKKMGTRVAEANAEHKDKPIDAGIQQLPPGIKNGVAKLRTMYTNEYKDDKNGPGTKGQTFFRASAVIKSSGNPNDIDHHNGQKVTGQVTSIVIPLCDMPAKGLKKAKSFSDNWFDFQNLFKLLGVAPCPETPQTDPTGQKTEAYFFAAMKTLTDPKREVHVHFSTRGWTPNPTPAQPKPNEMVFEEWHGLAEWNGVHSPAAGITEQPAPMTPAPGAATPQPQTATQQGAAPPPTTGQQPQYQPGGEPDPADVVASLVEIAMNDPEGATEEGAAALHELEKLAWAAGATEEQTKNAADWAQVGEMALGIFPQVPTAAAAAPAAGPTVTVGSKWKYAKRTKEGGKLSNAKGIPFPANEVEVVTVDAANHTCTLKSLKDGKPIVDITTKQPVAVKFEWLE